MTGLKTYLVRLAGEEHAAIANTQRPLLLLAFLIHFRQHPCLYIIRLRFHRRLRDSVCGIDIGAYRARRLGTTCMSFNMSRQRAGVCLELTDGGTTIPENAPCAAGAPSPDDSPSPETWHVRT